MGATKGGAFWKHKTLEEMTQAEWESLCDGCAKCCMNKIEDADTGEIFATRVACQLLDLKSCRCGDYARRQQFVPDCRRLTPALVRTLVWLPRTCAYRLLAEGRDLPRWHPLISGDHDSVHKAGVSVRGKVIAEREGMDLEDFIVDWLL